MLNNQKAEASIIFYLSQSADPYDIFRQLTPEDFTHKGYRTFFESLLEIANRGEALKGDVSVNAGMVNLLGDVKADMISSVAVKSMKTMSQRRKLQDAGIAIGQIAQRIDLDGPTMLSEASTALETAKDDRIVSTNAQDAESMFKATIAMAARAHKQGDDIGITHGIHAMDYFGKLRPGNFISIGARTGGGKTAFSKTMAMGMLAAGVRVGYVCKEMTGPEFGMRMLAAHSGYDSRAIESGTVEDIGKLQESAAVLACYRDQWQFSNAKTIYDAINDARRWLNRYGTQVFFFDYIQQFTVPGVTKKIEAVAIITELLKFFALENNVIVIGPAQLNRGAISKQGLAPTPPHLNHYKEAGTIEEDSDRCYLLWNLRNELGKDSDAVMTMYDSFASEKVDIMSRTERDDNRVGLFCRKYRGGDPFQVAFGFNGPTTNFYTAESGR